MYKLRNIVLIVIEHLQLILVSCVCVDVLSFTAIHGVHSGTLMANSPKITNQQIYFEFS